MSGKQLSSQVDFQTVWGLKKKQKKSFCYKVGVGSVSVIEWSEKIKNYLS